MTTASLICLRPEKSNTKDGIEQRMSGNDEYSPDSSQAAARTSRAAWTRRSPEDNEMPQNITATSMKHTATVKTTNTPFPHMENVPAGRPV